MTLRFYDLYVNVVLFKTLKKSDIFVLHFLSYISRRKCLSTCCITDVLTEHLNSEHIEEDYFGKVHSDVL